MILFDIVLTFITHTQCGISYYSLRYRPRFCVIYL